MTIHSDWSRVLHEECPEAFTKQPPKAGNQIGFVDGHLQLMRLNSHCGSWANFVMFQFVKPLRMLLNSGCKRVVLCFDSYEHVPTYKNMTQVKRVSRHIVPTFNEDNELPRQIPDDPMPFLMNRHFKKKIIDMVCNKVPPLIELTDEQHLIIDYQCVIEYRRSGGIIPRPLPDMVPMGESDVKFARYVREYGNALVHAIDGDYLMIALLYYTSSAHISNKNRIYIYRQLASPLDSGPGTSKRTLSGAPKGACSSKKPTMCWVDVQLLYCVIHTCMKQSAPAQLLACPGALTVDQRLVRAAVFFMLLAGTDFSRALPLLGPKRLWAYLPNVVVALVAAVGDSTNDPSAADILCDEVIGAMYSELFDKHVVNTRRGVLLSDVLRQLHNSTLSMTTKSRLPAMEQVLCTIKNIRWVIHYWETINGHVDTPLCGENGYVSGPNAKGVIFADAVKCG